MLRKIISTVCLCTFVFASESPTYFSGKNSVYNKIFSGKQAELMSNIFIQFNPGSALVILDENFTDDISKNAPKRLNPDKPLLTLSYRF